MCSVPKGEKFMGWSNAVVEHVLSLCGTLALIHSTQKRAGSSQELNHMCLPTFRAGDVAFLMAVFYGGCLVGDVYFLCPVKCF